MRGRWLLVFWILLRGSQGLGQQVQWVSDGEAAGGLQLVCSAPSGGIAVLHESFDLQQWRPAYAFPLISGAGVVRMDTRLAHAFYQIQLASRGVPTNLVWIPAGSFVMGSPGSEQDRHADEGPVREVRIGRGFWMGRFEVTIAEYVELMEGNPSRVGLGPQYPVENVTWAEAMEYCRRRTLRDRGAGVIPVGTEYRLPSEAEWEYAARAGTTTRYSFGDDLKASELVAYGWFGMNSNNRTHPVGEKRANPWGLHDIHGNVFEWCLDDYHPYPGGYVLAGPNSRLHRGGSWICPAAYLRCASRHPDSIVRDAIVGFRVVLGAEADTVAPELPQVATPTAVLEWSADRTRVRVSAVCDTEGARVRYTVDLPYPTLTSSTEAVWVSRPMVVRAAAFKEGWYASLARSIPIQQMAPPVAERVGDRLVLEPGVLGPSVEYSTDEGRTWRTYLEPLILQGTGRIQARNTMEGLLASVPQVIEY